MMEEVDEVALQVCSPDMLVLDEQSIVSLKDMDTDTRKRMLRAINKEIVDLIKVGTFEAVTRHTGECEQ